MNESMHCNKKIAILVATYNGERFLGELLQSLKNQTFDDWCAYIHDDGSTDKTMYIVKDFASKYPEHFKIVYGASTGNACNNFMFLFNSVEADYYMCCDQDDIWLPQKIEKTYFCMKRIEDNSLPILVYTDLKIVDSKLNTISESMNVYQNLHASDTSVQHLVVQNTVTGCTMMTNKALRDVLIKTKNLKSVMMHDWWAALIASEFGKIAFLNEATILYRQHEENVVGAKKFSCKSVIKKISSEERKKIHQDYQSTIRQAVLFSKTYSLTEKSLIYQYARVKHMNKIQRFKQYYKYNFHKSSFYRTIGLYIFG